MADKESSQGTSAKYAQRIDLKRDKLSPEQLESMRRAEMAQWNRKVGKLRGRNLITGLAIGGIVLGISDSRGRKRSVGTPGRDSDGYTFYSVSQEKFLDELEDEAKVARANYPKTSAN